jgi:hypothetical protein
VQAEKGQIGEDFRDLVKSRGYFRKQLRSRTDRGPAYG